MLTTARGTFRTQVGISAGLADIAEYHFLASQAEPLSGGRFRLRLEPAPAALLQVDYDGLQLYAGRTPGFQWNREMLDIVLPADGFVPDAEIHVRGLKR